MSALDLTEIFRLHQLPAADRARTAASMIEDHRQAMATLASIRAEAIRELVEAGRSKADIARELGVSPSAVSNLLAREP